MINLFSIVFRVDSRFPKRKRPQLDGGKTKTYSRIKEATKFPSGQRIECATLVLIKNIDNQKDCQQLIDLLENLKASLK